jgi:hypothetical protein
VAFTVDDPASVMANCLQSIRGVLGKRQYSYDRHPIEGGEKILFFVRERSDLNFVASPEDTPSPVIDLFVKSTPFWGQVSIAFAPVPKGQYVLASFNIRVFSGHARDDRKTPLFRAEWMSGTTGPGQPHWQLFENRAADQAWPTAHRFHFAMCSAWHDGGGAGAIEFDSKQQLARWISGCLKYIKSELGGD